MMLTRERLLELLELLPTGVFRWRVRRNQHAEAGGVAGCLDRKGYTRIMIDGKHYRAHRMVWLFTHGRWPAGELDHINGDRSDNRIENLREVTTSQNQQNGKRRRRASCLPRGVYWHKASGKFNVRIALNGHITNIGLFDTLQEAFEARLAAEARYHSHARDALGGLTAAEYLEALIGV